MPLFSTLSNLVQQAQAPIDTKNKNEVLYLQKLTNILFKSPIVQKIFGTNIKLVEDGIWGPKTEKAALITFGEIPSKAKMIAVENRYKELAANAVKAQSGGASTLGANALTQAMMSMLQPSSSVATPAAATIKAISTGERQIREAEILEKAREAARQIVQDRLNQQEPENPFNRAAENNTGKILLIGIASLAALLIILK